ncbi:TrkA C-terminal domain-containing protein [Helicobacter sp. MIT 14-3879]|uniref:TrkA C-terminal domain-containing protein n=1 Tax=Helicobacter sp. MIT 14-3879 TaxID=2040649 RepID=UPI000E1F6223|nr:TrkA C-terminal domain-containing protein [Helicobacter sp. MIT 14-3879]RDU62433.1 hypothetical protein CQA44_06875 [Helicobacter sp. MIT 14-3879]
MKQVLIIAKGKIAKIFLELLLEKYQNNNSYIVVSNDEEIISLKFSDSFKLYNFEPTSAYYLTPLINYSLYNIFVVLPDEKQREEVCFIIRSVEKEIPIILSCDSKSQINKDLLQDSSINTISTIFLTAKSLIENVPNIPIIARGFGLNKGEIMQINIPFGSAYAYISVGSILQKGWKIAGIYRQNSFMTINPNTIILPNDNILAVGDPKILNNIYKRISNNKNNFPVPFGVDIYVYIDFREHNKKEIFDIINDSLWLHKKIKNDKLVINIINPSKIDVLREIKNLENKDIRVIVDYNNKCIAKKIQEDSYKKIGLIIVSSEIFKYAKSRKVLYKANSPILKVGKYTRLSEVKDALVVVSINSLHIQNIAYTILDIASQINFDIKLYEFELDDEYDVNIANYYRNLGRIFNKQIQIEHTNSKNPILWLYQTNNKILQFIPLEIDLLRRRIFWFLNKNSDYLSLNINKNPQILLPI